MLFTFRVPLPSSVVLLAAPTSLLIIFLPSMILLSSGTPSATAAPASSAPMTVMNAKPGQGIEDLDLKKTPSNDRVPPINHRPPPPHPGRPGSHPGGGPWPGNGNGHGSGNGHGNGNGNGNWNGRQTTSRRPRSTTPAIIITEAPQPPHSSPGWYNKLGPGICYELCREQMGGVACPCDMMPVG